MLIEMLKKHFLDMTALDRVMLKKILTLYSDKVLYSPNPPLLFAIVF